MGKRRLKSQYTDTLKPITCKGAGQEDLIFSKLFNATLKTLFREINWNNNGKVKYVEQLPHLRFFDDVGLFLRKRQNNQYKITASTRLAS